LSNSVDRVRSMPGAAGLRRKRRGQSVVEFAFVVTLFMLFAMTAVDLGRGIFYYNMLANAAREGARYAVITSNTLPNVCNIVRARMGVAATAGCGSATGLTVQATRCKPNDANISKTNEWGTETQVTASYQFTLITPLISVFTGNPITLNAKSTMYDEDWGAPANVSSYSACVP